MTFKLIDQEAFNLILAGALLSITFNPVVFSWADRLIAMARARPTLRERFEDRRRPQIARLEADFEVARVKAAQKAHAHHSFSPDELAKRFSLFADLTPEQLELLLLHFEPVSAQPGERVIRAGDSADRIYFIGEGEVEVILPGKNVKLKPGDYFGEMALITGKPRSADVTAVDYCKFATLNVRDFRKFVKKFPHIRETVAQLARARGEEIRQLLEESGEPERAVPAGGAN